MILQACKEPGPSPADPRFHTKRNAMKILVGIASFGTKNDRYLSVLIERYKAMSYDVDIVVFSNIARTFDDKSITVIVGLPSENPWSLPFAHKDYFASNVEAYDLFIYTENDILIEEKNIAAFLQATNILPEEKIAGFMRYENDPSNQKYYIDVLGSFHWNPKSTLTINGQTFAHFTNEHSACYLLTRNQLRKAIASGGYLTPPRESNYDMLCTAATDPYTQCGFTKVICISSYEDFALHHLPNAYIGKTGINETEFRSQLRALIEIARGERSQAEFLESVNNGRPVKRAKLYYEPCEETIFTLVPRETRSVLSIGCGSAETESRFVNNGIECVCIPLDDIIGTVAEMKGVSALHPHFDKALNSIADRQFDCIVMLNIPQHVYDLLAFIGKCKRKLTPQGIMIGTIPNMDYLEEYFPKRYKTGMGSDLIRYYRLRDVLVGGIKIAGSKISRFASRVSNADLPTKKEMKRWLKRNGMKIVKIAYVTDDLTKKRRRVAIGPLKALFAHKLIFIAGNT